MNEIAIEPAPAPRPAPALPARLTVAGSIYFECPGDPPVQVDDRYCVLVPAGEQPYVRRLTIGPDWQPLDFGWLVAVHTLHLRNDGAGRRHTQPTKEEKAAEAALVVEVAVAYAPPEPQGGRTQHSPPQLPAADVPFARVRSGESARFSPVPGARYAARCVAGSARCILTLFPG